MKLFIPAVGYRIKLTNDWTFALYDESRNTTLFQYLRQTLPARPMRYVTVTLPSGSMLEVDRVYVRNANKNKTGDDDYDSVTFRLLLDNSKNKVRFWAKLADVNNVEYELPVDHMLGKTVAVERAKKPKRLTADTIMVHIQNVIDFYRNSRYSQLKKAPNWLNAQVIDQFKILEQEYIRLFEPYERQRHHKAREDRIAKLKLDLATGNLMLPVGIASRIKTIDDLKCYNLYDKWVREEPYVNRGMNWEYIIPYRVMLGSKTFERLSDKTCCRTYRPPSPGTSVYSCFEKECPDVSHLWLKIYSDQDDINIIKVEAGIDQPKTS